MQEANLTQSLPISKMGGDADNTIAASAYPSGGNNSLINLIHLGYRSLVAQLGDLLSSGEMSNSSSNGHDDHNKEVIRCYCLPCLKFGHGERGKSNVKTIFGLIFVPFFLLTFFLLDDFGRVVVRNMQLRQGPSGLMSNRDETGVIDFHLNRRTLKEFPGHSREVLLLSPSLAVQGRGASHSFEAMIKCPRGILFMFHGCGRYAASFFYSPQGRKMVELATEMGLGIVAFTKSEELGCWNWANDGDTVKKLAKKFISTRLSKACAGANGSDAVYPPMYAFGASSGGSFVGMLSSQMKQDPEDYAPFLFSAANIQIMAPNEHDHWDIPTVFTTMSGDTQTSKRVQDWVNKEMQVDKGPYKIITTSGRKPIRVDHFRKVFRDDLQMSDRISGSIHQDLSTQGVINSSTDEVIANPRFAKHAVMSIWQKYDLLSRKEVANDSKHLDASDVHPFGVSKRLMRSLKKEELDDADSIWLIEELNVAWDEHEITAEGFEDVLDFFLETGSARLE
ncbi:hypothetical protein ACHAWT_010279 [Skeletonema menzelii]